MILSWLIPGHGLRRGGLGMSNEKREDLEASLARLRVRLAERTASLPVHSIRPHQLIEIEELEEEIATLERRLSSAPQQDDAAGQVK